MFSGRAFSEQFEVLLGVGFQLTNCERVHFLRSNLLFEQSFNPEFRHDETAIINNVSGRCLFMVSTTLRLEIPVEELVKLYKEGKSLNALASKYGCHRGSIQRRLEREGVTIRGRGEAAQLRWDQTDPEDWGVKRGRLESARINQRKAVLSSLEQEFYDAFTVHGVEVVPQYAFHTMNLDFALPETKLAVEIESGNFHEAYEQSRRRDAAKFALLTREGWSLIRFKVWRGRLTIITNCSDDRIVPLVTAVCSTPSIWTSRPRVDYVPRNQRGASPQEVEHSRV